jgi:hypothetical protein
MDAPRQLSEDEMRVLVRICRIYDIAIVAGGVIAVVCGRVAGGLGLGAIGLAALAATEVLARRPPPH